MFARVPTNEDTLLWLVRSLAVCTVSGCYNLWYGRPGYVTCIGIIGGGMFWISGYLIMYPPLNKTLINSSLGHSSVSALETNILPFETLIHIGLFMLGAITYWRVGNILAFAMSKMGCFYIFFHSLAALVLLVKHHFHYLSNMSTEMILFPFAFSLWFLIPSFLGFIWIRKEHTKNSQLSTKLFHYS